KPIFVPLPVNIPQPTVLLSIALWAGLTLGAAATPANKSALERYYGPFLNKDLAQCTTCHLPSPNRNPRTLEEFPHNPFGERLRLLGEELELQGKPRTIAARLEAVAKEDADGDGVANELEILANGNPGDAAQVPSPSALATAPVDELARFLASYHWRPYDPVVRPPVPEPKQRGWVRTPIDAFIAAEHERLGLSPRPEAAKSILLRRLYLDLIGLSPTPDEQHAFAADTAPDAYEKVVDRLLADPRYGERWGRHWMDVWRYSDWAGWTDGKQIRDSQPHIWRWRDWIIESLNRDQGYDRMIREMLAGDELAPDDPETLRATGFLARNYKMLSREQWLEDTVKHTAQAFLGLTLGCAKCHDHRTDPISQAEYYQVRAIFEPHQVRIDLVPGELNPEKNGLARVYDAADAPSTFFFIRGDERRPDKDRVMAPGVPKALCTSGAKLDCAPVELPHAAAWPDRRKFVVEETIAAGRQAVRKAEIAFAKADRETEPGDRRRMRSELELAVANAGHAALLAVLEVERLEDAGEKDSEAWQCAARITHIRQADQASCETALSAFQTTIALVESRTKLEEVTSKAPAPELESARQALADAEQKADAAEEACGNAKLALAAPATTDFRPREQPNFPQTSTGRRLAFARWLTRTENPLTARVAVNHIWLRHFGHGIVETPENLGSGGKPPSHPALLDWLASEFMASGWKMKELHRLIVTSATYRMASTPEAKAAAIDPDNVYLWRMPSSRMEAELVRDNMLYVAGSLDPQMGGPEIDHLAGLESKRRSVYLQSAAEKEVEFLKIFDGPSVNECYQRRASVQPQQALALENSEITRHQSAVLAPRLSAAAGDDDQRFIATAFEQVLARPPTSDETETCAEFLRANASRDLERARLNLITVLFNHSDFVTIR
ncbi:MAG: DUF1553 domain-containing protein, partial [Chthoniobacteraceae bacterium]